MLSSFITKQCHLSSIPLTWRSALRQFYLKLKHSHLSLLSFIAHCFKALNIPDDMQLYFGLLQYNDLPYCFIKQSSLAVTRLNKCHPSPTQEIKSNVSASIAYDVTSILGFLAGDITSSSLFSDSSSSSSG